MRTKQWKKLSAIALGVAMSTVLTSCGKDSGSKEDATATTLEQTTESVIVDDMTEADTTEDTEAVFDLEDVVDIDENGILHYQAIEVKIPVGYEYSHDNSAEDSICFVNKEVDSEITISVDKNLVEDPEANYELLFDDAIKANFSADATHEAVSYNGHDGFEWICDVPEEELTGRALVVIEPDMIVLISYFGDQSTLSDYVELVQSLQY